MVVATGMVAHLLRFGGDALLEPVRYVYAVFAGALLTHVIFTQLGVYRSWGHGSRVIAYGRVLLGWSLVLAVLASLSFLSKTGTDFSRLWFGYWGALGLAGLLASRLILRRIVDFAHRRGYGLRNVALVGPYDGVRELTQHLADFRWSGYRVTMVCTDRPVPEGDRPAGVAFNSTVALGTSIREVEADEVWLTWPMRGERRIRESIDALQDTPVNIRWAPDIFTFRLINHGVTEIAGIPMLDLSISPISGANKLVKACEDYVLASIFLTLLSPLLLAIAVGVKASSPGPVLFRQIRHGWDGREIEVWKFRSMHVHREDDGRVTQARREDPRVTGFGAFLRRTSLDELPQLINVLQGRMSIVGPRPHALAHNEHYKKLIPNYLLRHRVKPGITGWAQVNGLRGETETVDKMQRRVEYDLYYIEHWSVWFDLRIIWRTAAAVLFDRNAY
ncbi:undecaprenyl-phosphate glucose phosphotransferase [Pseudazoarcus pumilus]|uniref:Undecaprenyl-phosphate glucose phosphotransferase n=2 Tax=Pseudazoarcus pumilus TaxID=2067960 RepID=A0A2I6SB45_9RHOO|nr:undecaprenyl-phosphate glucose phosphotransferase [Pseudazoarcus pumilus]